MTDLKQTGHQHDVAPTTCNAGCTTEPLAGGVRAVTPPVFENIYDSYFDFVWRSLRRLGVQEANVDDALQDVFIVVHRRLADFEGRSAVKTWLYGIVIRVASDYRRAKSRKAKPEELSDNLQDHSVNAPDEAAARRQAITILDQVLSQLDEDKRETFVLAEIEQLTAPEIAEALGLKLNTVYSRLRAARQSFEQALHRFRAQEERLNT